MHAVIFDDAGPAEAGVGDGVAGGCGHGGAKHAAAADPGRGGSVAAALVPLYVPPGLSHLGDGRCHADVTAGKRLRDNQ